MINIGSSSSTSADPRVDKAIERLEDTRKEIFDTDAWVEEIEQKIDVLTKYVKELPKAPEPVDVPDIGPLTVRVKALEDAPPPPLPRPIPIIPDIRPLHKAVAELKHRIEDVQADYNREMTDLWGVLKDIPKLQARIQDLEAKPEPKPDFAPVYIALGVSVVFNVCLIILSNFI
jgi:hypothetical protein